jgi:hypothetical protein
MSVSTRFRSIAFVLLITFCLSGIAVGQHVMSTAPDLSKVTPGFARIPALSIKSIRPSTSRPSLQFPVGKLTSKGSFSNDANNGAASRSHGKPAGDNLSGPSIQGLDTVPTFAGAFANQNLNSPSDPNSPGDVFPFIMIGNNPQLGGTTTLPTKITAVSLQLLNADGSVFKTVPFGPFEDLTLASPNFEESNYTSGQNIQFADAVQRAEFFNMMEGNWHTQLNPQIVNRITIPIPKFVDVTFQDGTTLTVQTYFTITASDGNTVVFLFDLLFSLLDFNAVVDDINAANFSTKAVNLHMYPNTFLFSLIDEQGDTVCCTLGFHTYFFNPGQTPQPRWIYGFVSWISPGIFRGGVQDVTALSHEVSEAFNDPFVNTLVPSWQFPGLPGVCQGNLETGDPVEVLRNSTVSINIRERNEVFTYHPQTEALLQWFEQGASSNAIGGAFSYPDTTALPQSATACPF